MGKQQLEQQIQALRATLATEAQQVKSSGLNPTNNLISKKPVTPSHASETAKWAASIRDELAAARAAFENSELAYSPSRDRQSSPIPRSRSPMRSPSPGKDSEARRWAS